MFDMLHYLARKLADIGTTILHIIIRDVGYYNKTVVQWTDFVHGFNTHAIEDSNLRAEVETAMRDVSEVLEEASFIKRATSIFRSPVGSSVNIYKAVRAARILQRIYRAEPRDNFSPELLSQYDELSDHLDMLIGKVHGAIGPYDAAFRILKLIDSAMALAASKS